MRLGKIRIWCSKSGSPIPLTDEQRRRPEQLIGRSREPSEQRVVADVSIVVAMLLGLSLVYALLFGATYLLGEMLFPQELLAGWVPRLAGEIDLARRLTFAGFVAFLGLIVGALGASFEEQTYFRHVTLVDEET